MRRVEGKVALVTGAALGIGSAAARMLAKEGARVAATDVLGKEGEQLVREINAGGGEARYWNLDVAKEDQVRDVVADVLRAYGRIDILVNNAGISGANKPTHEISEAEWDRVQSINVKGPFFCTKYVVPAMKKNGGGSIVNLSSIYGLVGAADAPPYHASKGALRLMTKTDALLYAADGIRVNSIHPGFIWTPMVENFLKQGGDVAAGRKAIDALHPLGHVGEPDDIAYGILYLASDEAKFITGSELVIDGGYTAR